MNFDIFKCEIRETLERIDEFDENEPLEDWITFRYYNDTIKSIAETDGIIKALKSFYYGNREFKELVEKYEKAKNEFQEKWEEKVLTELYNLIKGDK